MLLFSSIRRPAQTARPAPLDEPVAAMQLSSRPHDAAAMPPRRTRPAGSSPAGAVAQPRGRKKLQTGLFVTCLVDLVRPSIGFAALRLLEAAGCEVVVPSAQTCCGQPGYNSG